MHETLQKSLTAPLALSTKLEQGASENASEQELELANPSQFIRLHKNPGWQIFFGLQSFDCLSRQNSDSWLMKINYDIIRNKLHNINNLIFYFVYVFKPTNMKICLPSSPRMILVATILQSRTCDNKRNDSNFLFFHPYIKCIKTF